MIEVNKDILRHPDFTDNLADELCEMLESLMDEIFENADDIDFDFIDECADAINAIRSGDTAQILPIISRRDFLKKLNIKTNNKFRIAAIGGAAAALILIAGTQIKTQENVSVIQSLSGIVSEFFQREEKEVKTTTSRIEEPTVQKEKATGRTTKKAESIKVKTTEESAIIKGISVETTPEFKKEYYVGEKFINKGIKVFAEYTNGEKRIIQINDYTAEVSENFGTEAKYETVTIKANGFTEELTIRVIENLSTKKLNSIYAVFPDSFDFTTDNLDNFSCDMMRVYALYSDGSERELKKDEYTVEYEYSKTLLKEKLTVTVEHESCFCTFAVSKK